MIQPIPAGNALRLFITPPTGAKYWRVLKKGADTFTGEDDGAALVAYEGDEAVFVDSHVASLPNGVKKFFKPYYRMADDSWLAGATAEATPAATYEDGAVDVPSFLRERLEAGLRVEVERGNLNAELGYVQVYTGPPVIDQNLQFPLVTITVDGEDPAERALGEDISGDEFDVLGDEWFESEGWLENCRLSVVGWSLNADERNEMRKALRRIIIANLSVLAAKGITLPNVSFQDVDAVDGEYGFPVFQVLATFSCVAPVRVGSTFGADAIVNDIEVTANG